MDKFSIFIKYLDGNEDQFNDVLGTTSDDGRILSFYSKSRGTFHINIRHVRYWRVVDIKD